MRDRSRRGLRATMTAGTVVVLAAGLAGPVDAAANPLAEFYHQRVEWSPCPEPPPTNPSDGGIDIDPWAGQWGTMDCSTVKAPLNYKDPGGAQLTIQISRLKATDPTRRRGVLLINPGGPGGGGLSMPLGTREAAPAKYFDLIGFDPRGVGPSSALKCEVVNEPLPDTTRPTDEQFAQYTAYARAREEACQRAGGNKRPYINTANTARDMDVIRAVLGERKINYLGYSYGTYLGAVYGSLFPQQLNRSVLDSSIHPQWLWREQSLQASVAVRFNVEEWASWAGQRNQTYHLGTTKAEVLATTEALAAQLATRSVRLTRGRPANWPTYWAREFDRSTLDRFMAIATQSRPIWDVVAEVIGEVRHAATTRTAVSSDVSTTVGMVTQPGTPQLDEGVYDTVTCEADWPTDLSTYYKDMREFRDRYPYADGNQTGVISAAPTNCTFRSFTPPEKLVHLHRDGYPTGVVIQGDGDPATQYAGGPAMASTLNDRLISVRDTGRHGQYGHNQCVNDRIDNYLINGVLPPSRSECAAEPRPSVPADNAPSAARKAPTRSTVARVQADARHHSIWS